MTFTMQENFSADLFGYSTTVPDANWSDAGLRLMDMMWKQVGGHQLANKGINIWVYEPGNKLFAGVELHSAPPPEIGLESKQVRIAKYVLFKHIGEYQHIKETVERLTAEFRRLGINARWPYVEVYGHWDADPAKLETDLIWSLE